MTYRITWHTEYGTARNFIKQHLEKLLAQAGAAFHEERVEIDVNEILAPARHDFKNTCLPDCLHSLGATLAVLRDGPFSTTSVLAALAACGLTLNHVTQPKATSTA